MHEHLCLRDVWLEATSTVNLTLVAEYITHPATAGEDELISSRTAPLIKEGWDNPHIIGVSSLFSLPCPGQRPIPKRSKGSLTSGIVAKVFPRLGSNSQPLAW